MSCDEHPAGCPTPDPGRAFYASVRNGSRTGLLAGPYATHGEALAALPQAHDRVLAADPFAWFYAFGTLQANDGHATAFGRL
jgi:hypothetical protein